MTCVKNQSEFITYLLKRNLSLQLNNEVLNDELTKKKNNRRYSLYENEDGVIMYIYTKKKKPPYTMQSYVYK